MWMVQSHVQTSPVEPLISLTILVFEVEFLLMNSAASSITWTWQHCPTAGRASYAIELSQKVFGYTGEQA